MINNFVVSECVCTHTDLFLADCLQHKAEGKKRTVDFLAFLHSVPCISSQCVIFTASKVSNDKFSSCFPMSRHYLDENN